jgi:hypothetical protein
MLSREPFVRTTRALKEAEDELIGAAQELAYWVEALPLRQKLELQLAVKGLDEKLKALRRAVSTLEQAEEHAAQARQGL